MSVRNVDRYNGDWMQRRWADLNGLTTTSHPVDLAHPLMALVDARRTAFKSAARSLDSDPFHNRSFYRAPGQRLVSVMVTAPYLDAAARSYGNLAGLNDTAHRIARTFELYVRVGHPADTIHLSRWPDEPTVPIVFWNPARIKLLLPTPADPYPAIAAEG
ncbi:hypothetical protein RWH43_10710 [Microbacterium sp. KSW2-21]|uniref:Uncharacterized protein n=1 Tax=Microbacterium algihabitans TaxID=3075992 RepID=A0ABU3RWG3_9MICO|nr:hypothetical protein [Microbacterium sp. KSW2-21]MDU0327225.1 hypothetical protein [Microbacterium sp. KSW2-21]